MIGRLGIRRDRVAAAAVDMGVTVGSVRLANPVMTASGTAGHGAELAAYGDLGALGAVVVKSLHADPWPGNPPLRVHETAAGMINSVGLQGPGVEAWLGDDLPALAATGARVVASVWGRTVDEYRRASDLVAAAPDCVIALEVNLSCPNTEAGRDLFAHSAGDTRAAIEATAGCGRPRWAKLSPNVAHLDEIAAAAHGAGAEAVTLVNTVLGMAIDPETRRFRLGSGPRGGGLSGPAIHPIAVRAVFDVHRALPACAHRRRRGRCQRHRRGRAVVGGCQRRPGRHRHVRRSPGAPPGARRAARVGVAPGRGPHRTR